MSEHNGVKLNSHTKEKVVKSQFMVQRNTMKLHITMKIQKMDNTMNTKIQQIFNTNYTNYIAEVLLEELNKLIKSLLIKVKTQIKTLYTPY